MAFRTAAILPASCLSLLILAHSECSAGVPPAFFDLALCLYAVIKLVPSAAEGNSAAAGRAPFASRMMSREGICCCFRLCLSHRPQSAWGNWDSAGESSQMKSEDRPFEGPQMTGHTTTR